MSDKPPRTRLEKPESKSAEELALILTSCLNSNDPDQLIRFNHLIISQESWAESEQIEFEDPYTKEMKSGTKYYSHIQEDPKVRTFFDNYLLNEWGAGRLPERMKQFRVLFNLKAASSYMGLVYFLLKSFREKLSSNTKEDKVANEVDVFMIEIKTKFVINEFTREG